MSDAPVEGSAATPVKQDLWHRIVEVHWKKGFRIWTYGRTGAQGTFAYNYSGTNALGFPFSYDYTGNWATDQFLVDLSQHGAQTLAQVDIVRINLNTQLLSITPPGDAVGEWVDAGANDPAALAYIAIDPDGPITSINSSKFGHPAALVSAMLMTADTLQGAQHEGEDPSDPIFPGGTGHYSAIPFSYSVRVRAYRGGDFVAGPADPTTGATILANAGGTLLWDETKTVPWVSGLTGEFCRFAPSGII